MGDFLRLSNGIPRSFNEASSVTIYDEELEVVQSGAGAGEINVADAETGDPITLPSGQTYEDDELEIYLNGQRAGVLSDYNYVGGIPRTQISFTFDLVVGDVIRFRIDRPA